jgi:hypothetical protein
MITGVCEWEREETDEEKEMKSPRIYQLRVIQDIGCCTISSVDESGNRESSGLVAVRNNDEQ